MLFFNRNVKREKAFNIFKNSKYFDIINKRNNLYDSKYNNKGDNMKRKIIIEATEDSPIKETKRNVYKEKSFKLINNKFIEWLIYMIGYAIVLITVSFLFKSFNINMNYFGLYALLASIIIYVLNQTIKPIISYITLPLTIVTWGLMYPLSNVLVLYLTSLILGENNFYIEGFFSAFIIAIIISFLNVLMEGLILKPITKGKDIYG